MASDLYRRTSLLARFAALSDETDAWIMGSPVALRETLNHGSTPARDIKVSRHTKKRKKPKGKEPNSMAQVTSIMETQLRTMHLFARDTPSSYNTYLEQGRSRGKGAEATKIKQQPMDYATLEATISNLQDLHGGKPIVTLHDTQARDALVNIVNKEDLDQFMETQETSEQNRTRCVSLVATCVRIRWPFTICCSSYSAS
ncbi:hypothetical protein F4778DRAFT_711805 [Xylariomycetidae sp. FL2044]|nr:hypothetical protein F4778DRAFT_711805 [Xylariomycetidae sp. FL2044]